MKKTISILALGALLATGAFAEPTPYPNLNLEAVVADHHMEPGTVVNVAANAGMFTTLVKAVQVAGLQPALKGKGPFTVLAPTDAAFAKLPAGTVEGLLKDPDKLAKILKYHVIPAKAMAKQVMTMSKATTLEGSDVNITTKNGTVMVNGAKVIKADVKADNGVIHVIDTVLMPPDM